MMCLNLDVFFCCPAGYCRRIWGSEGVFDGRLLSPRALDRDIFTYISLWSDLITMVNWVIAVFCGVKTG